MAAERNYSPYTPTPGGSIPPPHVDPVEGRRELRAFFWLALLNTLIISVVGIVSWYLAHGH
jgi:hypothetical protein